MDSTNNRVTYFQSNKAFGYQDGYLSKEALENVPMRLERLGIKETPSWDPSIPAIAGATPGIPDTAEAVAHRIMVRLSHPGGSRTRSRNIEAGTLIRSLRETNPEMVEEVRKILHEKDGVPYSIGEPEFDTNSPEMNAWMEGLDSQGTPEAAVPPAAAVGSPAARHPGRRAANWEAVSGTGRNARQRLGGTSVPVVPPAATAVPPAATAVQPAATVVQPAATVVQPAPDAVQPTQRNPFFQYRRPAPATAGHTPPYNRVREQEKAVNAIPSWGPKYEDYIAHTLRTSGRSAAMVAANKNVALWKKHLNTPDGRIPKGVVDNRPRGMGKELHDRLRKRYMHQQRSIRAPSSNTAPIRPADHDALRRQAALAADNMRKMRESMGELETHMSNKRRLFDRRDSRTPSFATARGQGVFDKLNKTKYKESTQMPEAQWPA